MSTQVAPTVQPTVAELMAELAKAKSENEALKASGSKITKHRQEIGGGLAVNIGEKGGICVYGFSAKYPLHLYKEQFERLVAAIPALQAFVAANTDKLATKPKVVK